MRKMGGGRKREGEKEGREKRKEGKEKCSEKLKLIFVKVTVRQN